MLGNSNEKRKRESEDETPDRVHKRIRRVKVAAAGDRKRKYELPEESIVDLRLAALNLNMLATKRRKSEGSEEASKTDSYDADDDTDVERDLADDLFEIIKKNDLPKIYDLLEIIKIADSKKVYSYRDESGNTVLHRAVQYGHFGIMNALVKAGASVRVVNKRGDSLLHIAAQCGHAEIAKRLIELGADALSKNKEGVLPAELVDIERHDNIILMLKDHQNIRAAFLYKKELADLRAAVFGLKVSKKKEEACEDKPRPRP